MLITGIIPARYDSSRFPGKPLAPIGGKTVIRRVYEQASKALGAVYVATDDERIADEVNKFGGNWLMTSQFHKSGTDRCGEALTLLNSSSDIFPDVIINIQGDEPFIKPEQINQLADCFKDPEVKIATLIKKIDDESDINDPNKPKVVISENNNALYFSRAPIPYIRDGKLTDNQNLNKFFRHIGLYGYRADTLLNIVKLTPTWLEEAEMLEQNRWLQNEFKIRVALTEWESIGIDTPEDLENAKLMLNRL